MNTTNQRLYTLRSLNGLAQKEFAAILGVGQAQYSQIEKGLRSLTPSHKITISDHFKLDPIFFKEPALTYTATSLNYRRQKLSMRQLNMATATFGLTEQAVRIEGLTNSIEVIAPKPVSSRRSLTTIEKFAAETRQLIGIKPHAVINNVTRCLDKIGIIVTGLKNPLLPMEKIDGISTPVRSTAPFVTALNYSVPGDRFRFSAAHELGHIMLHTVGHDGSLADREAEADMFASAFLLPREPMLDILSPALTLEGFSRIKAQWGTSIQAIIRRSHDLGVIDSDRYRNLMIQLSSRGWRKNEPVHIPIEAPMSHTPILPIVGSNDQEPSLLSSEPKNTDELASVTDLFKRK